MIPSAFVKRSYLLDVALDELRGGHLLGRQTLLQLQLVRRADWLAPLHPAGTTERWRGWEGHRTKIVSLSLSQHVGQTSGCTRSINIQI